MIYHVYASPLASSVKRPSPENHLALPTGIMEKGAAEEPEPEPGPSSSSSPSNTTTRAAATTYDPREYQAPHPDDRGGGGGGKKATKGKGKGKAETKSNNAGANAKDKDGAGLDRCGNCDAEGALRACKQCGAKAYCSESCQRVSVVARRVAIGRVT